MSKERRKIGYFWVKVLAGKPPNWMKFNEDQPYVAEWDGTMWYFTGLEVGLDYDCVKVLSKCFVPPEIRK